MSRIAPALAVTMAVLAKTSWAAEANSPASDPQVDQTPVGAQVVARTTAQIGAPMAGQLVEFPLGDGEAFKEGQVLARFNCAQQEAMVARARAEVDKRQDILSTQQSLKALNAYSKADFMAAQNDVAVAQADLAVARTTVANCVVKAPFSGRVANIDVRNFQFVQMGAALMDILNDQDLEVELIVPSRWLVWLTPGAPLRVHISETQGTYEAHITRLSGRVDAASQTIKVYGRIDGPVPALLPGMSGNASFPNAPRL
jgi:membrane fusion protein (multidrug efflux system)